MSLRPPLTRATAGLLLGLLGVTIFAGTLPATRLAVSGLDPWFVTAGRAAVAGLLSLALLLALRRPVPARAAWGPLAVGAVCLVIGFPGFVGLAMRSVPAAHGGVVLGLLPLATAAFAALLLGERSSGRFWACTLIGAAIVIGFTLRGGDGRVEAGDLYLLGATIVSALGYVVSGGLARQRPGFEVISLMLVLALPLTLPAALWLMPADPAAVPAVAWIGFAYAALFSQFLGFFAWNTGLALGGVARVGQVQLVQTFMTLVLAAAINGEALDPLTWLAAAAVVLVVALGQRARRET